MIKTKAKATINDQDGINNVDFEINWDPNRKDLVKITLANKVSVIKRDDLWNFIFSVVKTDQQKQMIPVEKSEFIKYIKQHEVQVRKDMKVGDKIFVRCEVNIRKEVDDAVRREIEELKKLSTPSIESPYLTREEDK